MYLGRYTGAAYFCAYHGAMAQAGWDGVPRAGTADLLLELRDLERRSTDKKPVWTWLVLMLAGVLAMGALSVHGYAAYASIATIDENAKIATANPVVLFQDVATNGPHVGASIEASSRATYTKALEQFVLDGTGVILGLVLVVAGAFVRANL
jgi:hypothetical protein